MESTATEAQAYPHWHEQGWLEMWVSRFQSGLKVTTKLCLKSVHIISYIVILKISIIAALKEQRRNVGLTNLNQVLNLILLLLSKLPAPKSIIWRPSLNTSWLPYPYCCIWTKIFGTTVARKTPIANARSQRQTQSLASETNKRCFFPSFLAPLQLQLQSEKRR